MKFKLSLFNNIGDSFPREVERTWASLCDKFREPQLREQKDGLLFSPARYRGNRRLQRNVIELSLLVLEVDGAWKCEECNYRAPLVLFRNARHKGDRCPQCHKRDKRITESIITQIEFDGEGVAAGVRAALRSAFAIYSTHSHRQVTDKNPLAEPRFRIVVPLSEPIPVGRFQELWQWAVDSLQGGIPADPQDKDPNRCYYTPVKRNAAAPYECHIDEGEFLNWRRVLPEAVATGPAAEQNLKTESAFDGFTTHEDRNEELARRIMARGKHNSQGNWDAKCLAHGGKGSTALCYFPHTGAVKCNRGCDYYDLLAAEGLSTNPLPSRDRLAMRAVPPAAVARRSADQPTIIEAKPMPPTPAAKLHAIYGLLLAHLFVLTAQDETAIRRDWKLNPYGNDSIEYPDQRPDRIKEIKHCSMPTLIEQATACRELLRLGFDLRGVPGFYLIEPHAVPGEPSRASQIDRWAADEFGPWRLNLPYRKGFLVGYTNGTGYLLGIKIYRSTKDSNPFVLSSRGLPGGTRAVAVKESQAA